MNIRSLLFNIMLCVAGGSAALLASCNTIREDLPECRLYVDFVYDYNMLHTDAFATQVDKVELFVFDSAGKFLFSQTEEGSPLANEDYRMAVELPAGEYKFMAWAGAKGSYEVTAPIKGITTIDQMKLRLKRDASLVIDKYLEPLWYGEIISVDFTGKDNQTETINLIKDTNQVKFIFQAYSGEWQLNADDYTYEIIDANGYLDHKNNLLPDETLSYQPYFKEQKNPSAVAVEMNTMRLIEGRDVDFIVKEKSTGIEVFRIKLIDYLLMTQMHGNNIKDGQEYLDRESVFVITFFMSGDWNTVRIQINDWVWYVQTEEQ